MSDDIEGGDDKTRRNLVVASGTLIAAWIAGVPVPAVMEKLVGKDVQLTYWRVFISALLVLTYMILRFRFAPDTKEAFQALKKEWIEQCSIQVARAVQRALDVYVDNGKEAQFFGGELQQAVDAATENAAQTKHLLNGQPIALGRPKVMAATVPRNTTNSVDQQIGDINVFKGRVQISYRWIYMATRIESTGVFGPTFEITGVRRRWLEARAFLKLVTYTESSLSIVVPSALAAVAFCGLASQLVVSLLHPQPAPPAHAAVPPSQCVSSAQAVTPLAVLPASSTALPVSAGTPPAASASR